MVYFIMPWFMYQGYRETLKSDIMKVRTQTGIFLFQFLGFIMSLRTKNIENHKLFSHFEFLLLNYLKSVL